MHHDSESVGTLIEKINAMSLEELKGQLPLAQNSLESIELDLEELMALRDVNVIRVAAMTSRLSALQQAYGPEPSEYNRVSNPPSSSNLSSRID